MVCSTYLYLLSIDISSSLQWIFDICDTKKDDQELTLDEVHGKSCMDHLTSAFGITNDNIIKGFEALDQNGDSVVS